MIIESTKVQDYKILKISIDGFNENEIIPARFTCDGADVNPTIHISNIPEEAKTLAIIVDDPDAPGGDFCHWVTWNIPVTHEIKENESRGIAGTNDFGDQQYGGPCPPSGTHRYNFKIYALDINLELPKTIKKAGLEKAMADHIVGFGILTGKYKRP
jgi:Raf kinase inhibitor-like YbhB/YbcL family protein